MKIVLVPFSILYGIVLAVRNWLYDLGFFPCVRVTVPVISVGNLTMGGTGKTPLVMEVARWALSRGKRPVILTRGYRSGIQQVTRVVLGSGRYFGDEPALLKSVVPEAEVVICPNRVEGARESIAQNWGDLLILDDGFQHRRLHRDLNLLVVDASESSSSHWPVPAGRAREFACGRCRADALLFTKLNLARHDWTWKWKWWARDHGKPVINVEYQVELSERVLNSRKILVVTAIAKPQDFVRMIRARCPQADMDVISFRDHHQFQSQDIERIVERWNHFYDGNVVCTLVTTEKDATKLSALDSVLAFEIAGLRIQLNEKERFHGILDQVCP